MIIIITDGIHMLPYDIQLHCDSEFQSHNFCGGDSTHNLGGSHRRRGVQTGIVMLHAKPLLNIILLRTRPNRSDLK